MRLFILPLVVSIPLVAASPTLLDILSGELQRNFTVLKQKGDPPPYYMAYTVTEAESQVITASLGTITSRNTGHARYLDITVRVGTPGLDNYHMIKGERARFTPGRCFRSTTSRMLSAASFGWTPTEPIAGGVPTAHRDQIQPGGEAQTGRRFGRFLE